MRRVEHLVESLLEDAGYNVQRIEQFRKLYFEALLQACQKKPEDYPWFKPGEGAEASVDGVVSRMMQAIETKGIRAVNMSDFTRRLITRQLGISNTLAAMDTYLKGGSV